MEWISFIGIVLSLVIIILGSLRGYSLILLSTIAALLTAITGSFGAEAGFALTIFGGYGTSYMSGVASIVVSLFPLFLGGQMFGKMLELTGLPISIANLVFKKLGPSSAVTAVFLATLFMSIGGINVFVIIFTMYPLASAFFKEAGISRSLIPACVLGGAVAQQTLPGMPVANLILPAQAFNVSPMAGSAMAVVAFIIVGGGNFWYLRREAKKSIERGEGFQAREGETISVDLNAEGLPNALFILIPLGAVVVLLNVFKFPAWAALYCGVVVIAIMFFKRLEGMGTIIKHLAEAAQSSQSVMGTAAICGLATIIGAVPGYNILLRFLESSSFGSPYILAAVSVAVIAGFSGSATGGLNFALANFTERLLAAGADPRALTRVIAVSALSFDSLPHNSAIVLTLSYCKVTHKEGYKHLFFCTVLTTCAATIATVIMAHLGII